MIHPGQIALQQLEQEYYANGQRYGPVFSEYIQIDQSALRLPAVKEKGDLATDQQVDSKTATFLYGG